MAWTEANLLSNLASRYLVVGTPEISQAEDVNGITWMVVNVLESGKSEKNAEPTACRKNIFYYVVDRGDPTESAFYHITEPKNEAQSDPIDEGHIGNELTAALFNNNTLRNRVLGQILTSALEVYLENPSTTNHAERVALATKVILDANIYVTTFMGVVSLDTTIRTKGTTSSDAELASVVNSRWTPIAVNMG